MMLSLMNSVICVLHFLPIVKPTKRMTQMKEYWLNDATKHWLYYTKIYLQIVQSNNEL